MLLGVRKEDHDIDLLLHVCEMYYEQGLTQQEIADIIGVSKYPFQDAVNCKGEGYSPDFHS